MSGDRIFDWAILPALAAFRTAVFEQRAIVLSPQYRNDKRVEVGACPGLSLEWIRMHARWPNQTPAERCKALDTLEGWEDAAAYTGGFNEKFASSYAAKIESELLLTTGTVFTSSAPATKSAEVCTFFDPTNKYALAIAHLSGISVSHICAGFASTSGRFFKSKHLTFFDPNFGEFAIELTASSMKKFMEAWIAQFATYRSGRTGKTVKLGLSKLEVIQLQDVIGTRARR